MPPKRRKTGSGKRGKKRGKSAKTAGEKEQFLLTCRNFVRVYQNRCQQADSPASIKICSEMKECIEAIKPLEKFVVEPNSRPYVRRAPGSAPVSDSQSASVGNPPAIAIAGVEASATKPISSKPQSALSAPSKSATRAFDPRALQLQPLIETWIDLKYHFMKSLYIWNIELSEDSVVTLSLFFESILGPCLKVLEIMEGHLSSWSIGRLSRSLRFSQLNTLGIEYNTVSEESLARLCDVLQSLSTVQVLRLNYCGLGHWAGERLGILAANAQIKEMHLAGNSLQCQGAIDLLRPIVTKCESLDLPNPLLVRLSLQDNSIDTLGMGGVFGPVTCMGAFRRWILAHPELQEINLDGNYIGEGGGREVMLALRQRKEAGMPLFKMVVTHRLSSDVFSAIFELGPSKAKKGRRKKGKKK